MERLEGLARRTRKRIVFIHIVFIRDATQGDCGYTKARSFDVVEILHRRSKRGASESDGRD